MLPMSFDRQVLPARIGPFRVVRQLGVGGASAVYLAERADSFSQRVAIKLFREIQSRAELEEERRTLASLDHAHIVRLLDQGTTETGLRYLVMEFVDGVPIDQYCEAGNVSKANRIQLLIKVLNAVGHAQRHMVVHADIKPSNILVDGAGEPKVLDFGISQRTTSADPLKEGNDQDITRYTPAFASPEQLAGAPVKASSDIYSVGLVARLLLGSSSGSTARDDLSLILDKATRAEPELRYSSAQDFADDLRAWLDHRPIGARKGNRRYRAGKWVRRHRTATALAVTLLVALAVSVAGVFVQTVRAIHQRQLATQRLHEIVGLTGTLAGELYDSVQLLPQGKSASGMLLRSATSSLDAVAAENKDDPALALQVAQQYDKLAQIERTRNHDDAAAASDVAKELQELKLVRPSHGDYAAAQAQIARLGREGHQ